MKKYGSHILCILVLLGCFPGGVFAQDINVAARLDKQSIALGDQTVLHLSIHLPKNERADFPVLTDTLAGKVIVLGRTAVDTLADKNNPAFVTLSRQFTITCFDAGTHFLPVFSFKTKSATLMTDSLLFQVLPVKVDTTKAIYDIKQPLLVNYSWLDWLKDHWVWIFGLLVLIVAAIFLIRYLKRREVKQPEVRVVQQKVAPDALALAELRKLKEEKLWQQGQVKPYHSALSDVLRDYLENRFAVKTQEKTTAEILAGIQHLDLGREESNNLRQVLLLADLVKFAKEKPLPAENEQSIENAINFVLKTGEGAS